MSMKIEVNLTGTGPLVQALNSLTKAVSIAVAQDEIKSTSSKESKIELPTPNDEPKEKVEDNLPTLEQVRAKLAALTQSGKQAEVKALITKYGAKKLSDIPEERYPELLKDAEAV